MANRLQRVLAMDEAMKARDEPKAGMHDLVNADGSVTQIPYMEDKRGRRTVMTREGPRVIRGHEGKNLPGDAIGEGLRNVLGGLFGKGGVPGGTPPFVPAGEDYFDMSKLGPKSKTALSRFEMPDGSIAIQQTVTDAQGNPTIRFLDPNTGQQIGSVISPISETPNVAAQTRGTANKNNPYAGLSSEELIEKSKELRSNRQPSSQTDSQSTSSNNRFGAVPKPLNASEQKIQDYLAEGYSVDGRPGTVKATTAQRQAARVAADKKPIKRADVDYSAALLLSDSESKRYMSGTLSDEDFRKLHNKAMTRLAKEPEKKSEGVMDKERAFSQMQLAMPTLAQYEADPQFVKSIAGYSGSMARNFRATANPDERMYLQAADAWVRAKLRDESGAAISEDEMAKEYSTFFPQFNDTPEVIAEKARMRGELTEQMGSASGVINPSNTPPATDSDLTPLVVGTIEIVEIKEEEK
tara:strand:+ start:1132 stop:2532 length:1401 start_codon:yes stop_codon:yes gene_type:complete